MFHKWLLGSFGFGLMVSSVALAQVRIMPKSTPASGSRTSTNQASKNQTSRPSGSSDCFVSADGMFRIGQDGVSRAPEISGASLTGNRAKDGTVTTTHMYPTVSGDRIYWKRVQVVREKGTGMNAIESSGLAKEGPFENITYSRMRMGSEGCVLETKLDYSSKSISYDKIFCDGAVGILRTMKQCADQESKLKAMAEAAQKRYSSQYKDVKFDFAAHEPQIANYAYKVGSFCKAGDRAASEELQSLFGKSSKANPDSVTKIEIPGLGSTSGDTAEPAK